MNVKFLTCELKQITTESFKGEVYFRSIYEFLEVGKQLIQTSGCKLRDAHSLQIMRR